MDETIYNELLRELVFEECIDINYALRTGQLTVHEPVAYNLEEYLVKAKEVLSKKVVNPPPPTIIETERSRNGQTVFCPVCGFEVSGKRFAPHLEKCFRGIKRGAKSSSVSNSLSGDTIKIKKPFVDPYPDSLVIKIKLKNGVPRSRLPREGVPLSVFQDSQKKNGHS